MTQIVRGDQRAFELLYDRYVRYVYSICLRVLRSAEDAEDATLDTFCKIWQEAERYDRNRASVLSYLVLLARSRAIDLRRARSARLKREQSHGPRTPTAPDPSDAANQREARERVHAALSKLPTAEREAVQLSFLEGLSHREIAERLGQPLGTTKTRIRHGLIQLRQTLRT
jgi:RNA polymerase sigma-70 factor (ECF subfamily)